MALLVKLIMLAFMACIFILASNMQAFLYMNQFYWFRKVRNVTAFFFMFIGRLVASAFAWVSGQEHKLRTEQVHQATVLIVEIFTLFLLVSTATTIYHMIIERMNEKARKQLREIDIETNGIQGNLAQIAATCANFPAYGAPAIPGALPALRTFFQPPHPPVLKQHATAAEVAAHEELVKIYENRVTDCIERIQVVLHDVQARSNELATLQARLENFSSTCDDLERRFSIFTRIPADVAFIATIRGLINRAQGRVDACSTKLKLYSDCLVTLMNELAANLEQTRAVLDAARRIVEQLTANAAAASAAAAAAAAAASKQEPVRNPWKKAVLVCAFLVLLQIAVTNSETPAPKKNSSSPSTQLALLMNYFDSGFSNYFRALALEIVGIFVVISYMFGI